jgi:hypothetical protein
VKGVVSRDSSQRINNCSTLVQSTRLRTAVATSHDFAEKNRVLLGISLRALMAIAIGSVAHQLILWGLRPPIADTAS